MSNPVSALQGEAHTGFVTVEEGGLAGMLTLRGEMKSLAAAVKNATGCAAPAQRGITTKGAFSCAWMSTDELLVLCPHAEAEGLAAELRAALEGSHHLVANVSDARALFRIRGAKADQVVMKLCPTDIARLPEGELRRTRAAQVAAALWRSGPEEISLICFRSVAAYVMALLKTSAASGSEIA